MSQLRMFLDMEKHPLPDYPVPEGFRITRNGPEVAERYEVLREGAGWGKLKPDFLTNKVIPKGLVFCEEIATGLPVASATAEFSDYRAGPQPRNLSRQEARPCRMPDRHAHYPRDRFHESHASDG